MPTATDSATPVPAATVKEVGLAAGLRAVGITHAEPFEETRAVLEERRDAGLHDTMAFTYRNPERSTTPQRILESAESVIVGARAYPTVTETSDINASHQGRIAAYAWRDHYKELRHGLEAMADVLRAEGWTARVVADDNALVDRAAAVRAGIGWFGKNSNVLLPSAGSYFVLGAVVTNAPLDHDRPLDQDCGTCRRCLDGCPTGAIVAPGVVDAGRCLAWLLQREGMFPIEHRAALGNRIYGCDDCQEVCPPSRLNTGTESDVGAQPVALTDKPTKGLVDVVDLLALLEADDDAILDRHGRWYIPRRDVNYVRRNALIALVNAAVANGGPDDAVTHTVTRYLSHEDEMLRAHAVWSAARIGQPELYGHLSADPSELVQAEIAALA